MRVGLKSSRGRLSASGLAVAAIGLLALGGFRLLDSVYPPDLSRLERLSTEVVDREGRLLRSYLSADGMARLPTRAGEVDPRYIRMLIAFEDKRFRDHPGVDPLALARAAGQAVVAGRIVSGASTLTMQTARLLGPRPRGLAAKLVEMFRALQLERRHTKDEILDMYLTLAPFGGNLEGVRAASRAYFGREPKALTAGEAALLVALPRAPGRLRPDRAPAAARTVRDLVLARVAERAGYAKAEIALARREPVGRSRRRTAFLAPHLADRLRAGTPDGTVVRATLDAVLQRRLQTMDRDWAREVGQAGNVAILVVANAGRAVRAHVGSADFHDATRHGRVDFARAVRSPGSTLKPIIYGLAFDRGLAHPATIVEDAPTQFGDYAPANFMDRHYGEISLAEALRLSLNVPAVALLDRLGPVAFVERLRREGIALALGAPDARPGLAVALGGVGITLEDLVRLYAALASDGRVRPLRHLADAPGNVAAREPLLRPLARWQVVRILRSMNAVGGRRRGGTTHRPQDRHFLRVPRRLGDRLHRRSHGRRVGRPTRRRAVAGPLRRQYRGAVAVPGVRSTAGEHGAGGNSPAGRQRHGRRWPAPGAPPPRWPRIGPGPRRPAAPDRPSARPGGVASTPRRRCNRARGRGRPAAASPGWWTAGRSRARAGPAGRRGGSTVRDFPSSC